ncbi:MAG: hypothetical protein WCC04_08085 [Terriglobales bacterium]
MITGHTNQLHVRHGRKGRTTLAACLLGLAFLSLLAFVAHIARPHPLGDQLAYGNDPVDAILGLIWFTSGVLATIMGQSLHSPARQLVLVGGGMLTILSIFFWISVAASM